MVDAEVKDQAPAPGLIPEKTAELHKAAPLACACRDSVLCAQDVSGRAEQRPDHTHHPVWLKSTVICFSEFPKKINQMSFFFNFFNLKGYWFLFKRFSVIKIITDFIGCYLVAFF